MIINASRLRLFSSLHRLKTTTCHYQTLGFCPKSIDFQKISDTDIKSQFYEQAKIFHPDA